MYHENILSVNNSCSCHHIKAFLNIHFNRYYVNTADTKMTLNLETLLFTTATAGS